MYIQHKKGFSLVLFLIYILIFSLISCGICHIIATVVIPSLRNHRECQSLLLLQSAIDIFVRDIRMNRKNQWKALEPQRIIWNDGEKDREWRYHDKKLERIEGIYEKEWKSKYTSVIATNLAKVLFSYHYKNSQLSGVTITVTPAGRYKEPLVNYVSFVPKKE